MKEAIRKRADERLRRDTRPNCLVQDYWKSRFAVMYRALGPHRPSLRADEEKFAGLVLTLLEATADHYEERIAALEARIEEMVAMPALPVVTAAAEEPRRRGRPPRVNPGE